MVWLDISYTKVDDYGISVIANSKNLKSLLKLDMEGLRNISRESLEDLFNSSVLPSLFDLEHIIMQYKEYKDYKIVKDIVLENLTESKRLRSIRRLNLANSFITSKGIIALCRSENACYIQELNLANTLVDDAGIIAIANARHLRSLISLNLENCTGVS